MLLDTGWRFRLGDQENALEVLVQPAIFADVSPKTRKSVTSYRKDISVRAPAEIIAVNPDLAVFVNAVKAEKNFLSLCACRKSEMPAVPCGAADNITRAAGEIAVFRIFHGPVVRERNLPFRYDVTDFLVFGDTSANIAGCTSTYRTDLSCSSRAAASRPDTLNCSDAEGTALPCPEPALRAK